MKKQALPHSQPARFRCVLDAEPLSLLPRPALAELRLMRADHGLVVNPCCQFEATGLGGIPFLDRFDSAWETIWLLDPASNALSPFHVGPALGECLRGARPGEPLAKDLSPALTRALRYANVLVPAGYVTARKREWKKMTASLAATFRARGFVALQSLLHPFHVAALRRYFRELASQGELQPDLPDYPDRSAIHSEVTTQFFHHQLTLLVSQITGEPVQPSYAYLCSYRSGAQLEEHTDREQCEFTISVCIDFEPEPETTTSWPLYIRTEAGPVAVRQSLGDGVLFLGRELPHYREPLPRGCSSTSVFFHFVPRGFVDDLD